MRLHNGFIKIFLELTADLGLQVLGFQFVAEIAANKKTQVFTKKKQKNLLNDQVNPRIFRPSMGTGRGQNFLKIGHCALMDSSIFGI